MISLGEPARTFSRSQTVVKGRLPQTGKIQRSHRQFGCSVAREKLQIEVVSHGANAAIEIGAESFHFLSFLIIPAEFSIFTSLLNLNSINDLLRETSDGAHFLPIN